MSESQDLPAAETSTPSPERRSTGGQRLGRWRRGTRRFLAELPQSSRRWARRVWPWLRRYFTEYPVTFKWAVVPLVLLSVVVFTRSLWTNYIFDEQEALLANPYVNGGSLEFWRVVERDFWGHPANRTVGSYRPLPNVVWRLLFKLKQHAWPSHFVNVLLHGVNGALVASFVYQWMKSRRAAWYSGLAFTLGAIVTEAVCAVVGLADVMSGTFILLGLHACRYSVAWQLPLTFVYVWLGFMCKEATLTVIPMVALTALFSAPIFHPNKPQRWTRFLLVGAGSALALIAYTYFRRHFFQINIPEDYKTALPVDEPYLKRAMHEFLRWFQQLKFVADPFNNPLGHAEPPLRIAGALRVYFRGLVQVVFPWQLSGDYSFPQEPVPEKVIFPESVLGALLMIGPPILGIVVYLRGVWREYRLRFDAAVQQRMGVWLDYKARLAPLAALCLIWVPFTFFPQSNIPVVLPTVRAERFWYVPLLATSMLVGCGLVALWRWAAQRRFQTYALAFVLAFFAFQGGRARAHALDYRNDLVFWKQTAKAVPNSAKAHLNYGVMLGARNNLEGRLVENGRALELAPEWPMANIYYGDTLCRLHRPDEAWPHYARGFELGPNQQMLISLALQCLWDEKVFEKYKPELEKLAAKLKGSWVAYLVNDMKTNGEKNKGVDPKYRSRGYNGGPRQD
jgi:tetratricopeptide (TPR) repeat protein